MKKDTFYFSHDYNARNDEKIKKLISKHLYTGYGLYWAIIEDLYNNTNVLRLDYDSISFDLRTTPDVIKSIINDFDLFVINGDNFGSLSVERRLNERNEKSKKAKESILLRWNRIKNDTNVLQTNNDSNSIKEKKVKENKEIKIIEEEFELFWNIYDKKTGKDKCLKKWLSLKDNEKVIIFEKLPLYINNTLDVKYRKDPLTYLNGKHWNDEIIDYNKPRQIKYTDIKTRKEFRKYLKENGHILNLPDENSTPEYIELFKYYNTLPQDNG